MKGLLYKEFYSLIGMANMRSMLFFAVMSLVFGATGIMPFMLLYMPIILAMLPRTVIIYDEQSKWQQFSLAMPYSRKDIVSAKYLVTFLICLASSVVCCAACVIGMAVKSRFDASELIFIVLIGLSAGLLIPSIALPLDLKFGTAKAKFMTLIYGGVLGITGGGMAYFLGGDEGSSFSKGGILSVFPYIFAAAALAVFGISWLMSVKFYEKREF